MHGYELVANLSASLLAAFIFGLITQRLGLTAILGYLLAGVVLGPHTPGFVGDIDMATQFAEVGVILLMFGVGLHFHLDDLRAVQGVAIPGAIGQSAVATMLGVVVAWSFGMDIGTGLVIGMSISVASTVVLIRMLLDNNIFETHQGRIAVGWLIVEDLFTVIALVLLPSLSGVLNGGGGAPVYSAVGWALIKMAGLVLLVWLLGRSVVPWLLRAVARTRSRELFTLAILSIALAIASGSALIFGVSMALGAFLGGMVVGQTEVSQQAGADALPMRDAFAVLFFVSVGMLFDPAVVLAHPLYLGAILAIIMLAKPLAAMVIIWALGYTPRAALTVAIALAQIGEFSFILADGAFKLDLITNEARSLLVACAVVSIALNPFLFRLLEPAERVLRARPRLWALLSARSEKGGADSQRHDSPPAPDPAENPSVHAVVVGYGPVGRTAVRVLNDAGIRTTVIDLNLDTVRALSGTPIGAVYGDASRRDILVAAGFDHARYLLLTLPDASSRSAIVMTARELNPQARIFARTRYLADAEWLRQVGVAAVASEEAEVAPGLAALLLEEVGATPERIGDVVDAIRRQWRNDWR